MHTVPVQPVCSIAQGFLLLLDWLSCHQEGCAAVEPFSDGSKVVDPSVLTGVLSLLFVTGSNQIFQL